ncbi:MAG: formyltransferase family protein [Candidatus Gottesmanbacteria bacterium]|nr:formyltransferase family protein [Candidatus Gottesmanbacteria bacterium]
MTNYEALRTNPVVVISSCPDAPGMDRARALNVPVEVVGRGDSLLEALKRHEVEFIAQTGWLPKTPPEVIDKYRGMIINQHPGRLPDFGGKGMYGARVTCATIAYFWLTGEDDFWTASTVHHVTEEFDAGDLIQVTRLNIFSPQGNLLDATRQTQERLLRVEHDNVISVLSHFGNGSVPRSEQAQSFIDGSADVLYEAKRIAIELFPKG